MSEDEELGRKAAEAAIAAGCPKWAALGGQFRTSDESIDQETGLPILYSLPPSSLLERQKRFIEGHNAAIRAALANGRITKTFAGRWHSKEELLRAVPLDEAHDVGRHPLVIEGVRPCVIHVPPKKPRAKHYIPMVVCEYADGEIRTLLDCLTPVHAALIDNGMTIALNAGLLVIAYDVETLTKLNRYLINERRGAPR